MLSRSPSGDISFGSRLPPEALAELRSLGTRRAFVPGELLFLEGSSATTVYYVESGLIKVHVSAEEGAELILGIYGSGELLCEMSSLEETRRSASGTGRGAGFVTEIPSRRFRGFMHQNPVVLVHVLGMVQHRLRNADQERLLYLSEAASPRVARKLLDWCAKFGVPQPDGRMVITRFTRRELAQSVAASEKTIDEVLTTLAAAELVITGRMRFEVLNPEALHKWLIDSTQR